MSHTADQLQFIHMRCDAIDIIDTENDNILIAKCKRIIFIWQTCLCWPLLWPICKEFNQRQTFAIPALAIVSVCVTQWMRYRIRINILELYSNYILLKQLKLLLKSSLIVRLMIFPFDTSIKSIDRTHSSRKSWHEILVSFFFFLKREHWFSTAGIE